MSKVVYLNSHLKKFNKKSEIKIELENSKPIIIKQQISGTGGADLDILSDKKEWVNVKNLKNLTVSYTIQEQESKHGFSTFTIDTENDTITNTWYLLNTSEMDEYHMLNSSKYMIKLLDQSYSDNVLIEFEPSNITNNHLQYAVTWFLLSFVIMIMYIYYIRQKVQKNEV